jgi:hypothetical protein
MNNSRGRKRIYPSAVLRATVYLVYEGFFLTPASDCREGQRRVMSLYLVYVVSHAALRVRFPVCSEGSEVGLLVVSVIHIFLLPFITQSVHYKYNLCSRIWSPTLLESYTIVIHIKQTQWDATVTLLDCGTQIIRPRNSTDKKSIPCLRRIMNLRCCSVCLKILHIMPWLSHLWPGVLTNRVIA